MVAELGIHPGSATVFLSAPQSLPSPLGSISWSPDYSIWPYTFASHFSQIWIIQPLLYMFICGCGSFCI